MRIGMTRINLLYIIEQKIFRDEINKIQVRESRENNNLTLREIKVSKLQQKTCITIWRGIMNFVEILNSDVINMKKMRWNALKCSKLHILNSIYDSMQSILMKQDGLPTCLLLS